MSRLSNAEILRQIVEALDNATSGVNGYVVWKRVAWEWVAEHLDAETQRSMARRLLDYVNSGEKVDQVVEKRGFDAHYHYDFRPRINNVVVYIETVLKVDRMGPQLYVVSVHLA